MSISTAPMRGPAAPEWPDLGMPKAPVFSWSSLRGPRADLPCVDALPGRLLTSSGRAAIHLALQRIGLRAGDSVLLPSYHCPTMVAPVLLQGGRPEFYGIDTQGLPLLDEIPLDSERRPRAILVAHYFGLPRSLAAVRHWCDREQIALIEDCAHALFGLAGERPVGCWGDHATASLTKFLPMPECGVLVSSPPPADNVKLGRRSNKEQVKSLLDTLQISTQHRRLWGLNTLGQLLVAGRRKLSQNDAKGPRDEERDAAPSVAALLAGADMARVDLQPVALARLMARKLPRGSIVNKRRANYERFARLLVDQPGLRPLFDTPCDEAAPYVFPLWVDDADRVYRALRRMNAPVFRWDRIWPGVATAPTDNGPAWSKHVLQLLCHQDLTPTDIDSVATMVCKLAAAHTHIAHQP